MKVFFKSRIFGILVIAVSILGSTAVLGYAMATAQGSINNEVVFRQAPGDNERADDDLPAFPVNAFGQTYGSGGFGAQSPDLILATGIDGIVGYVLRSDLDGETGPVIRPNNPDEAALYMEKLEELAAEARARGEWFVYTIPLYASDGRTVIGEFAIGDSGLDRGLVYYGPQPPSNGADAGQSSVSRPPAPQGQPPGGSVESVTITYDGRETRDVTEFVGGAFTLTARVEPAGQGEIIWTSSDRSIFEVVVSDIEGTEATITAIGSGTATLRVSVGGVEAECVIRVRPR